MILRDAPILIEGDNSTQTVISERDHVPYMKTSGLDYQCGAQFIENEYPSEDHKAISQKLVTKRKTLKRK